METLKSEHLVELVLDRCRLLGTKIVTAESCTGGLLAGVLTEVAGSSDVFECGFVTYSNEAKSAILGVPKELLQQYGAVSEEAAVSMAEGAILRSGANLAISVTGIAGPGGGDTVKPVGLVHMAIAREGDGLLRYRDIFDGDRSEIRNATVEAALTRIKFALIE